MAAMFGQCLSLVTNCLYGEGGGEWGGRALAVRLVGTAGAVTVPAAELKAALGLKERWFTLVGARRRW